jgi:hypothetical protein
MQACQRYEKKSYKHFMLNSQQRSQQKNKRLTHKTQCCILFFVAAVPKDSQRFPKLSPKIGGVLFMPSPSSRSMAKPAAAWQLRYCFYFF